MHRVERRIRDYQVVLSQSPDDERLQYVLEQIRVFNDSHSEYFKRLRNLELAWQPLALYMGDEEGELTGGVIAYTNQAWGWMTVSHIWVAEPLRGKGYGTGLLQQAEEESRRRECYRVELQTWSFQAPEFYEKRGYRVIGQLDDNPPGLTRFWFRKDLV